MHVNLGRPKLQFGSIRLMKCSTFGLGLNPSNWGLLHHVSFGDHEELWDIPY